MVDDTRAGRILSHLATYHVTLQEILEQHVFDGKSVRRELWDLSTNRGLVAVRQGLTRRRSYYQLTAAGAASLGLSAHWARPLGAQSLIANLSLAWFCCMGKLERRRISRVALAEKFNANIPGGYHCVEKDGDRYRVYRVYVPMPGTAVQEIVRAVGTIAERCKKNETLADIIKERTFGFAVLLETQARAKAVEASIRGRTDSPSLMAHAHVRVESVPDFVETHRRAGHVPILQQKEDGEED